MSQQINLYSPILRKQTKVFSAVTMLQGVVLIAVVVAAFGYALSLQGSLLRVRADDTSQQLKAELERLKVYGSPGVPADRVNALAERKKALEASLASQKRALVAFESGALGRTEGYAALLRSLARLSMDGVWLTRIHVGEAGELSLTGRATRAELVPAYLDRLRSEEALREQKFDRLELTRQGTGPAAPGTPTPPAVPFVEFVLSSGAAPEPR